MFGGQFIAAPVTKKSTLYGMVTNNVWIPEGRWTDFFTGDVYHGGKWKSITRYLDSFPLLAKEGAFFLLDGNPSGNKVSLPKVLKVVVFLNYMKIITPSVQLQNFGLTKFQIRYKKLI